MKLQETMQVSVIKPEKKRVLNSELEEMLLNYILVFEHSLWLDLKRAQDIGV